MSASYTFLPDLAKAITVSEEFTHEHPCYECNAPWYCWIHCRHGALFDCFKRLPSFLDQRLQWTATDDGMPEPAL